MTYKEKLLDPRWQRKRLEVLNRDNWTCQACYSTDRTLHIHHLDYEKDADPWDYPDFYLQTLCSDCHEEYEKNKQRIESSMIKQIRISVNTPFVRRCFATILGYNEISDIFYLIWELGVPESLELLRSASQIKTDLIMEWMTPKKCPAWGNDKFIDVIPFASLQCTTCGYVHKYGQNTINQA